MPIQVAGEGWIGDLYDWFPAPQWMQVYDHRALTPLPDDTALPTVVPESVRTAETCFRKPDGWIICVPLGIWADSYRNQGFPEISGDSPEFLPPSAAAIPTTLPPAVVVSSDSQEGVPGDETDVAIDWGTVFDAGTQIVSDWLNPAVTPMYDFTGGVALPTSGVVTPAMTGGTCGRSPCVCGVDSCGRPALIDPRTGKRCYKRRRPKLLSDGDFNSLMRIATLPNNQNVRIALAKAIGRR